MELNVLLLLRDKFYSELATAAAVLPTTNQPKKRARKITWKFVCDYFRVKNFNIKF